MGATEGVRKSRDSPAGMRKSRESGLPATGSAAGVGGSGDNVTGDGKGASSSQRSSIATTTGTSPDKGLSVALTQFYAASILSALAHIHDKGVAYRDIKPENIMLDERGYIKVIDFGFAKKVPYAKKLLVTGKIKTFTKTYTLCGTPEYLSPEMVFNLGHDHATDIWSAGVLIYEMLLSSTPFASKKSDNTTEVFTNIALVKKNGFTACGELLNKAGSSQAHDLIEQMLQYEPKS